MKNALRLLAAIAMSATFALPAFALTASSPSAPAAQDAAGQDNEARAALYEKFLKLRTGDAAQQKMAYETGKEYISKYGSLTDENNAAILKFIQNWVAKYEKVTADYELKKAFEEAVKNKDYPRAFELGNKILANEPENTGVVITLANVGYANSTQPPDKLNKSLVPETIRITRRLIESIEAGKITLDQLKPLASKEEALAYFNLALGYAQLDSTPEEAAKTFIKVAQSNSSFSKEPTVYSSIAFAYTTGEYKKAAAEYQQKFPDGTEITPERKPEYDQLQGRLNWIADRIIDAYARAVALSTKTDPATQRAKNDVMARLTAIYKNRNSDSEAGLKELIGGVLAKRMPLPTDPMPAPSPAPTTTTTTSTTPTAGDNPPQTSQTTAPAKPAADAAKPTSTAQPKPQDAKPASTAPAGSTPKPISKATKAARSRSASGR